MNANLHIVTGPGRACLCGFYGGRRILCHEIIAGINRLEQWAKDLRDNTAATPPTPEEVLQTTEPIKALIQNLQ